jgi:hypothetical protein
VATTTEMEKIGRSTEAMARGAQQSAYIAMSYAVKAQEVNTELVRKMVEAWIEGFRKQTELSQDMAQEFFERAEDQAYASQVLFGRWAVPFVSFPFVRMPYDPFSFWRERRLSAQESVRDTGKTAVEETRRVIETTAPGNGSFPIAGYDEKNVKEITGRLDTLTVEQLRRVKDYERRHKNRETLLQEIDRKIGTAS